MRAAMRTIGEHRDRFARDGFRREGVLNQLRHDPLAGDQVHHPDHLHGDQPLAASLIGQRRQRDRR